MLCELAIRSFKSGETFASPTRESSSIGVLACSPVEKFSSSNIRKPVLESTYESPKKQELDACCKTARLRNAHGRQ